MKQAVAPHLIQGGLDRTKTPDDDYAAIAARSVSDVIVVTDCEGRLVWANHAFEQLTAYAVEDVVGQKPGHLLQGADTDPATVERIAQCMRARIPVETEILNYTREGHPYWIELHIRPVPLTPGSDAGFVAVSRDISARRAQSQAVSTAYRKEARIRNDNNCVRQMSEWLFAARSMQEVCTITKTGLERLLPFGAGRLYVYRNSKDRLEPVAAWGSDIRKTHIHPDTCWAMRRGRTHIYGGQFIDLRCAHLDDGPPAVSLCLPIHAYGETIGTLSLAFEDLPLDPDGKALDADRLEELQLRMEVAQMCSERVGMAIANVRLREELRTQSTRDVLTGLNNRRWFMEASREALEEARNISGSVSFVSVDVDHFKVVNDKHGHATGDMVLRMLAGLMANVFDGKGVPCRIGGEEFVVLLAEADKTTASDLSVALCERVREGPPSGVDTLLPAITVSAGVATFPADGEDVHRLLNAADEALYKAKHEGRDKVVVAGHPPVTVAVA
ncbi:MAG: diguanylate cyclase [Pseudomonadota bacterium]